MPLTQTQYDAMFRTALSQFPTGVLRVNAANWTATTASVATQIEFAQGGGAENYDVTLTATKPDGAAEIRPGDRVLWNTKAYTVARVRTVMNGSLYVIGLNRGSVPRG